MTPEERAEKVMSRLNEFLPSEVMTEVAMELETLMLELKVNVSFDMNATYRRGQVSMRKQAADEMFTHGHGDRERNSIRIERLPIKDKSDD